MSSLTVSGRVLSDDGSPVAGAAVYVVDGPSPIPDIAQITGPDGRYSLRVLTAGSYRIGASVTGRKARPVPVDVGPGGALAIDIHLTRNAEKSDA